MRKLINYWAVLVCIVFLQSCNYPQFCIITVEIDNIDTSGVFFQYIIDDSIYNGCLPLNITDETFFTNDSLKIRVNKMNPTNIEFVEIVKQKKQSDTEVICLDNKEDKKAFGYYQIDKKPIISGAKNEFENDSVISELLYGDLLEEDHFDKYGVYILIDKFGNVHYYKSYCKNETLLKDIKKQIEALPSFSPAIHNGDSVSVTYLIEVPVLIQN